MEETREDHAISSAMLLAAINDVVANKNAGWTASDLERNSLLAAENRGFELAIKFVRRRITGILPTPPNTTT